MDGKKLKEIASQLRKASAMHKGQAAKIDRMIKGMNKSKKKYISQTGFSAETQRNQYFNQIMAFYEEINRNQ